MMTILRVYAFASLASFIWLLILSAYAPVMEEESRSF